MAIVCKTSEKDIEAFLGRASTLIHDYILNALAKLGEESVAKIRERDASESWIDHTGNLRSSIGFSVYDDGKKYMQSAFSMVLNGAKGQSEGQKMIRELSQKYSKVFALVVIAAMDYAKHVEAIQNKDVLESTRIWAQSVVKQRLDRAKYEALKEINTWTI